MVAMTEEKQRNLLDEYNKIDWEHYSRLNKEMDDMISGFRDACYAIVAANRETRYVAWLLDAIKDRDVSKIRAKYYRLTDRKTWEKVTG